MGEGVRSVIRCSLCLTGCHLISGLIYPSCPQMAALSKLGDLHCGKGPSPFEQCRRIARRFGALCYSVSPKGAEALQRHCSPVLEKPIYSCPARTAPCPLSIDIVVNKAVPGLAHFRQLSLAVTEKDPREVISQRCIRDANLHGWAHLGMSRVSGGPGVRLKRKPKR